MSIQNRTGNGTALIANSKNNNNNNNKTLNKSAFISYNTSYQNELPARPKQGLEPNNNNNNNNNFIDCGTFKSRTSITLKHPPDSDKSNKASDLTEKATCSSVPVSPCHSTPYSNTSKTKLRRTACHSVASTPCDFNSEYSKNFAKSASFSYLTGHQFSKSVSLAPNFDFYCEQFENSAFSPPFEKESFSDSIDFSTINGKVSNKHVQKHSTELNKAMKIVSQDEIKFSERYFSTSSRKDSTKESNFVESAIFKSKESLTALTEPNKIVKPVNKSLQQKFNSTNNFDFSDAKTRTKTIKLMPNTKLSSGDNIDPTKKEQTVIDLVNRFTTETSTPPLIGYSTTKREHRNLSVSQMDLFSSHSKQRTSSPVIGCYETNMFDSQQRRDRFLDGYLHKYGSKALQSTVRYPANHSNTATTPLKNAGNASVDYNSYSLPRRLTRPVSTICLLQRDSFVDDPMKRKYFLEKYLSKTGQNSIIPRTSH